MNLLRRYCSGRITAEEYNRQYYRNYAPEFSIYKDLRILHFNEDRAAVISRMDMEVHGVSIDGPKTREQLCTKYR